MTTPDALGSDISASKASIAAMMSPYAAERAKAVAEGPLVAERRCVSTAIVSKSSAGRPVTSSTSVVGAAKHVGAALVIVNVVTNATK